MAAKQPLKLLVVTDPMCSWCWGMAAEVDQAIAVLGDRVEFGLVLGGVNVHGTQPIGEFGRRHLFKVWQEVEATTGQPFAYRLPDPLIYNSTLTCLAVRALGEHLGVEPFAFLHHLQYQFFVAGKNINDHTFLASAVQDFGWRPTALLAAVDQAECLAMVQAEFEQARSYGTQALPSLLLEIGGRRQLLAGGYVDALMIEELVSPFLNDKL